MCLQLDASLLAVGCSRMGQLTPPLRGLAWCSRLTQACLHSRSWVLGEKQKHASRRKVSWDTGLCHFCYILFTKQVTGQPRFKEGRRLHLLKEEESRQFLWWIYPKYVPFSKVKELNSKFYWCQACQRSNLVWDLSPVHCCQSMCDT